MIAGAGSCLKQMIDAYHERAEGGCMVAAFDVPENRVSAYGIINPDSDDGKVVKARGLVEKPTQAEAPSRVAVIGRYILTPEVLAALEKKKSGAGGEIQLTDAIAEQVTAPGGVVGYRFEGKRYDCGSKSGFLEATVAFALEREDLRDEFYHYIKDVAKTLEA